MLGDGALNVALSGCATDRRTHTIPHLLQLGEVSNINAAVKSPPHSTASGRPT